MSPNELRGRLASLIDEIVREGPDVDSAAFASILLAALAALRDGELPAAARALWDFLDAKQQPQR
jgi:hypothetical protein